jgi:hypothetical protein
LAKSKIVAAPPNQYDTDGYQMLKCYRFLGHAAALLRVPCSELLYYNDPTKSIHIVMVGQGQADATEVE